MTATPPLGPPLGPAAAGKASTVEPGKEFVQMAISPGSQCVSWRSTTLPASSHLRMTALFRAAWSVCGEMSHWGFQTANLQPLLHRQSLTASKTAVRPQLPSRSPHVLPAGRGPPLSMAHRAEGERTRQAKPCERRQAVRERRAVLHADDLAGGSSTRGCGPPKAAQRAAWSASIRGNRGRPRPLRNPYRAQREGRNKGT